MEQRTKNPVADPGATTRIEAARFEPLASEKSTWTIALNPRLCLVAALLVIGAFCAWFMLTARAVYIETEPLTANVDIAAALKLKLANRYLIRPGAYELDLSAPGYRPAAGKT